MGGPSRGINQTYRFTDKRGEFRAAAWTTEQILLYKAYARVYPPDKLPSWGEAKLIEMIQAESNKRKAQRALETAPFGDPERKRILDEVRYYAGVVERAEKILREALAGPKLGQTMRDIKEGIAQDVIDNTEFGKKLKRARGDNDGGG